ncbi:MAG: YbhB/YbcL family Raf kinase inhibitor-like protein [Capsulimonadales bacterium]|nr:YbhB/YbcL family Raf kinase inhibitor-like protein [Capsulimonadales bacterium]
MRIRTVAFVVACLFFAFMAAGCPSGESASGPPTKRTALAILAPKETLTVTLPDIPPDGKIPDRFSAYGSNETPTVRWSGRPANTQSFLLLLEDPDAPGDKPYVHYLVYNLPSTAESVDAQLPPLALIGANTNGQQAYFGPRPPSGKHRYHFQVFALSNVLNLDAGASWEKVRPRIEGFVLAGGEAVATYEKR